MTAPIKRRAGLAERDIKPPMSGASPAAMAEGEPPLITGHQANNTVTRARVANLGRVIEGGTPAATPSTASRSRIKT